MEAFRAQQVTIDAVRPSSPPMISILVQRVEVQEGEVTAVSDRHDRVYRKAQEVVTETITIQDPVTGLTGSISVAGLEQALRLFSRKWISEDLECEIDPITGWAINCKSS